MQTDDAPERRCAALQTEPPDDERPHSPKIDRTTKTNACTQNVSNTKGTAVQVYNDNQRSPPAPKTSPEKVDAPPLTENGRTATRSPRPAPPAQPSPTKEEARPKTEPRPYTPPGTTPFTPQRVVSPPPTSPHVAPLSTMWPPKPRAQSPLRKPRTAFLMPNDDDGPQRQYSAVKTMPQHDEHPQLSKRGGTTTKGPSPILRSPPVPMKRLM